MLSYLLPYTTMKCATRKSPSGLLADATGYSPRYFRGMVFGPKTKSGQRRLADRARDRAIPCWRGRGFPVSMVREWLSSFDPSIAERRTLEYWLKQCNGPDSLFDLPHTLRLAREIDALSVMINDVDATGDAARLKDLLANEPGILRFNRPGNLGNTDMTPEQYLLHIQHLDTDEAWNQYATILVHNASMALLAQLDKEYTAQYFRSFVPRHSFRFVTPYAKPDTDQPGPAAKTFSDPRIPPRRLLDVFACIAHRLEHDDFPTTVPPMSEFALQAFDPDDGDASPSRKLKRWRRGEVPLTHQAIDGIWNVIDQNLELAGKKSNNAAPWPLAVAAVHYQCAYVESGRNGINSFWFIDDDYQYWLSQSQDSAHGDHVTEPWPDCFSRI